jgi:hypothetical protein
MLPIAIPALAFMIKLVTGFSFPAGDAYVPAIIVIVYV